MDALNLLVKSHNTTTIACNSFILDVVPFVVLKELKRTDFDFSIIGTEFHRYRVCILDFEC